MARNNNDKNNKAFEQKHYSPVVVVVGHVDHGKTTLLDALRKSSIAEREYGGITQRIGASKVTVEHEGKQRSITFIDTPGHEAFIKMRSRGAQVADIGLLVISAVDGVMPQTKESIKILKEASIPFIVVLTKIDLPDALPERVKKQLMNENVILEEYGGDIPCIEVSAKTNKNINELLDLILLVYDLNVNQEKLSPNAPLEAVVIESKLDPRSGPRATVVVKNGKIQEREEYAVEGKIFRVRTLINDVGKQVKEASIGEAVEILGLPHVPSVGSFILSKDELEKTREQKQEKLTPTELRFGAQGEEDKLSIILVADTQGSLEAITYSLPSEVEVIEKKTGEITEADILLAKSTGSIVLGFNTKIRPEVQKLALTEKVLAKNYNLIYEMLDEIKDVIEGKKLAKMEQILGKALIKAMFPFDKKTVLGVKVEEGRVAKGDRVRIMRGNDIIGEGIITSLKQGKNPVTKVEKGNECGILISSLLDFKVGDMVISHT